MREPECPLSPERMAWPFKTDEERELLIKWMKAKDRAVEKYELENFEQAPF